MGGGVSQDRRYLMEELSNLLNPDPMHEKSVEELLISIKNGVLDKLTRNKIDLSFYTKLALKEPENKIYSEEKAKRDKNVAELDILYNTVCQFLEECRAKQN